MYSPLDDEKLDEQLSVDDAELIAPELSMINSTSSNGKLIEKSEHMSETASKRPL